MSAPQRSSACCCALFAAFMMSVPWIDPGADQHVLGERDRRNPDLVAVCRERQPAVRLCRAAVVRPGALFRLRHVRRRDRHRPDLGLSFWPAFGLGIVAAMAMALVSGIFAVRLTWHYFAIITVVFSLIFYFLALEQQMADRRRRRHQFHAAADLRLGGAQHGASPIRPSSTSSFWRRSRSASG